MEFRPINNELMKTCATNKFCTKCPLRIGCPIRYSFYKGDISVELALQATELQLQPYFGEQGAFDSTNSMRHKILCERGEHPGGYSYT